MDNDNLSLNGLWIPLITPLREGRVDVDALQLLATSYRDAGIAGVVMFGSTGEGNLLSMPEKFLACEAVRDAIPHLPLLIGVGGVETLRVCQSIRKLERLHPDGWLVPPPYYLRPAADGILWHYQQVASASDRPIVIYNVPKRTGVAMSIELMEFLCDHTSCVAVKECDPELLADINTRGKLVSLCGEDLAFLDHFEQQGAGAISAAAHIRPDAFVAVMNLAKAGRTDAAHYLFETLKPVIHLLFAESSPAPIKKVLSADNIIANELRLPMTPASDMLGKRLSNAIARIPTKAEVRQIVLDASSTFSDRESVSVGGR